MLFYIWGPPRRSLGKVKWDRGCMSHMQGARAWREGNYTRKCVLGEGGQARLRQSLGQV